VTSGSSSGAGSGSAGGSGSWWTEANRIAILALIISCISALATAGQALYAAGQLQEARQQFDSSGPLLSTQGYLTTDTGDQLDPLAGLHKLTHVTYQQIDQAKNVDYIFIMSNIGRLDTRVTSMVLFLGNYYSLDLHDAQCSTTSDHRSWQQCVSDKATDLQPGDNVHFKFDIKANRNNLGHSSLGSTEGYQLSFSATGLREPDVKFDTEFVVDRP
jgi:hypothetical protein